MASIIEDFDTELSAVNSILGSLGQAPLNSLEFTNPEVAFIYNILIDTILDVQSEGWSFNTEEQIKLTPNGSKEIPIPSNYIKVDAHDNYNRRLTNVIVKDGKLYDKMAHSYEFNDPILCDVIELVEYENLPLVFKRYIAARSATRAATQMVANRELAALLSTQEAFLRASCMEYECNQSDASYFGLPDNTSYQTFQPYRAFARN